MITTADLRDRLILHLTPGLGPRLTAALLSHFGSATAILQASSDQLALVPGIGPKLSRQIKGAIPTINPSAELLAAEEAGVHLLGLGSPDYPAALAEIPDAPGLLYVKGALAPADAEAVGLVGSRTCTEYGLRVAQRLAAGLARAGVTVVSGLARGIDGAAHRATLQAGGRTLAVLAGGLSRIYPPEHRGLAEEVTRSGALVTESCMNQEPLRGLFPQRNRLISGLCRVVVLVEADEKSGALITASHAAEQGRTAMAVPGPLDNPTSAGCHAVLRQGAVLCRGVEDILEELRGVSAVVGTLPATPAAGGNSGTAPTAAVTAGPPAGLDEGQMRVWGFLGGGPRNVDEMAQTLGLGVVQLSQVLLGLEMRKVVRRLPGNRYERW